MSRRTGIIKNVVVAILLMAYIVVSVVIVSDNEDKIRLQKIEVIVQDSLHATFVTASGIERLILDSITPLGRPFDLIHLNDIERRLALNPYIDSVEVTSSIDGVIHVRLSQRTPCLRVLSENGYNFYIDSSLHLLAPCSTFHPKLPIISGILNFDFATDFYGNLDGKKDGKDAENLKKLINFVGFVERDDFLRNFIAQIFVTSTADKRLDIELVARVGNALIIFGSLDDTEDKLLKTKAFYRQTFNSGAIDSAKQVDVRFKNQIIVR